MLKFIAIVALFLGSCKYSHDAIKFQSASLNRFEHSVTETDSNLLKMIKPYSDSLSGLMNQVVGFTSYELTNQKPEGLLGNFISDALLQYVQHGILPREPVMVLLNSGGLRAPLPKGNITLGRIFETLPFENNLVILKIPLSQMDNIVNKILERKGDPVSNIIIHKEKNNVHWEFKNNAYNKDYIYIITSDYLANGGDGYTQFKDALEVINSGFKLRDVLLMQMQQYKRENKVIEPIIEGRILIE